MITRPLNRQFTGWMYDTFCSLSLYAYVSIVSSIFTELRHFSNSRLSYLTLGFCTCVISGHHKTILLMITFYYVFCFVFTDCKEVVLHTIIFYDHVPSVTSNLIIVMSSLIFHFIFKESLQCYSWNAATIVTWWSTETDVISWALVPSSWTFISSGNANTSNSSPSTNITTYYSLQVSPGWKGIITYLYKDMHGLARLFECGEGGKNISLMTVVTIKHFRILNCTWFVTITVSIGRSSSRTQF